MAGKLNKLIDWYQIYIKEGKYDAKELILIFIVALYPLIVLPDPMPFLLSLPGEINSNYYLGPRYIILAAISPIALSIIIKKKMINYQPLLIPLTFFVLFASISAFLAPYPFVAWIGSPIRFTGVFTYYFCIILFLLAQKSANVEVILDYMVVAAGIVSLTAVLQYFGLNIVPHDPSRDKIISYGTMWHHNILGTYTAFILPAAVMKYIYTRRISWFVLAGIIYAGLLVSLSRGCWIGFSFGIIIIGLLSWKKVGVKKYFAKTILLFILITIILLPARNYTLMNRFVSVAGERGIGVSDNSGSYRVFIWKESSKLLLNNWEFGIGPDHLIFKNIIQPDSNNTDKAHNIYLEIAVTMGIFALMSYLIFLGCFFRDYKNDKTFIFKTMILVYLVQGFFSVDVVMVMPIFWIVLGLSIASQKVEQKLLPA